MLFKLVTFSMLRVAEEFTVRESCPLDQKVAGENGGESSEEKVGVDKTTKIRERKLRIGSLACFCSHV